MKNGGNLDGGRRAAPGLMQLTGGSASVQAVLDAIRLGHAQTRREVVLHTGLSASIVARRVDELIALGLLDDSEHTWSTGGRAPRRLRLRGDYGRILAVNLGVTSARVTLSDMAGDVLAHREGPIEVDTQPQKALEAIHVLVEDLLAGSAPDDAQLVGIGMGLPGPVAFNEGVAVAPPLMPAWDGYPLRQYFEERYHVPAWIDNDVNLMALGEVRAGGLRDAEFGIAIKIGAGIGAGITTNGVIHRGAQGCAGDVGHIRVSDTATGRCRCGNIGCLESLAGGVAIAHTARDVARSGESPMLAELLSSAGQLTAEDVSHCAQRGDAASMQILDRAAELVGSMLAMIVNTLNPDVVVVGGGVAKAGDFFVAGIRRQVYGRSLPLATRRLRIERSELGDDSGVIGATWLAIDGLHLDPRDAKSGTPRSAVAAHRKTYSS
ncbi:MAG: transcriptional regulator/sugar kinase [Acidimicrobiaceae bacterium]|nr:transcriptional regulator/sugar kinase [Acidimicrobiaceae bacterium]